MGWQEVTVAEARRWYDGVDPVHGLDHALRVLGLAERIGRAEGADLTILRAAALLHDAAGAAPGPDGQRQSHEVRSAQLAERVLQEKGWPVEAVEAVAHCIRAHRFRGREAPRTLEAKVLFDADKLDVIGAFGVARTLGYAMPAGHPISARPSARFIADGQLEPGEPHSAYHEYLFKLRRVQERLHTAEARRLAGGRFKLLRAFFEQLAREAAGEA